MCFGGSFRLRQRRADQGRRPGSKLGGCCRIQVRKEKILKKAVGTRKEK